VRWGRRGLVWGDFIVAIDDKPTPDADAIYRILDEHKIGDWVILTIQKGLKRVGKRHTLKLKLTQSMGQTP